MVAATGRAGADALGVLLHEPDHAAVGPPVRCLVLHRAPGHPTPGSAARARAHSLADRCSRPVVDRGGTLIPVRDRKVAASSRNYRFSGNVQVIVDADTRPVIAAARPVPRTTADAHAWRVSGLSEHCQGAMVLGDGAYLNCGTVVPHHKRPARASCARRQSTITRSNATHRQQDAQSITQFGPTVRRSPPPR